jgi:hypothetical protein
VLGRSKDTHTPEREKQHALHDITESQLLRKFARSERAGVSIQSLFFRSIKTTSPALTITFAHTHLPPFSANITIPPWASTPQFHHRHPCQGESSRYDPGRFPSFCTFWFLLRCTIIPQVATTLSIYNDEYPNFEVNYFRNDYLTRHPLSPNTCRSPPFRRIHQRSR